MRLISNRCYFQQFLKMNYLAIRSRFAAQGVVSSHELRMAFPEFDKRRLV